MTDLIYTATEARNDFFNMIKIAEAGKRRVIVENKKSRIELLVKPKKVIKKKFSWKDLGGGMSDADYKTFNKMMEITDKAPARGTPQW